MEAGRDSKNEQEGGEVQAPCRPEGHPAGLVEIGLLMGQQNFPSQNAKEEDSKTSE